MMKGGRRAVFCYGQHVWSKRIEFRRALTLLVEASAGECRSAKGPTTLLDRRGCRPTLGKHRGNCDARPLESYFGLKICEREAVPSRAAVEPLVTKSDLDALAAVCVQRMDADGHGHAVRPAFKVQGVSHRA